MGKTDTQYTSIHLCFISYGYFISLLSLSLLPRECLYGY